MNRKIFRSKFVVLSLTALLIALALLPSGGVPAPAAVHADPGDPLTVDPYGFEYRTTIVHLFEWTWDDIARECEEVLGPKGYAAVQVSPPQEHAVGDRWWVNDDPFDDSDNDDGYPKWETISHPWWQRYQPVSYRLYSRSGDREQFIHMVEICHAHGVDIYVDAVINHMTGVWPPTDDEEEAYGEGNRAPGRQGSSQYYPEAVTDPYYAHYWDDLGEATAHIHFPNLGPERDYDGDGDVELAECFGVACGYGHTNFNDCGVSGDTTLENDIPDSAYTDYTSGADQIRNCELANLIDLKTGLDGEYVRGRVVEYLNSLVELGVDGFRIDAAKHIHPNDIDTIIEDVNRFADDNDFDRPYFYLEVIDEGAGAVEVEDYDDETTADITEFKYGLILANEFRHGDIDNFRGHETGADWEWGDGDALLSTERAVVFVDNHDNQRKFQHESRSEVLTHKYDMDEEQQYILGNIFMLAWPYGTPKVMSSYDFDDKDQGPPTDDDDLLWNTDAVYPPDGSDPCSTPDDAGSWDEWICEHRWTPIANMVGFRNATYGESVNWHEIEGEDQIAFSRGNKGFVAINNSSDSMPLAGIRPTIYSGIYCDVAHGEFHIDDEGAHCDGGDWVLIDRGGYVYSDRIRVWDGLDWVPAVVDPHEALAVHADADTSITECPVTEVARIYRPQNTSGIYPILYNFRDQVMSKTPQGKKLINTYYHYTLNTAVLLMKQPRLAPELWDVLKWTTPALDRYMNGQYDQKDTFTQKRYDQIESIYYTILKNGDPNLAQQVQSYWSQFPLKSYVGQPLDTVVYKAITVFIGKP